MYVCMCVCNINVQLKRNFTTGSFFEKDIKPPFTEETIGAKRFIFFCMFFFNRLYLPKPLSLNEKPKTNKQKQINEQNKHAFTHTHISKQNKKN